MSFWGGSRISKRVADPADNFLGTKNTVHSHAYSEQHILSLFIRPKSFRLPHVKRRMGNPMHPPRSASRLLFKISLEI